MTEVAIICSANQWTGFYMITASVMKGLSDHLGYLRIFSIFRTLTRIELNAYSECCLTSKVEVLLKIVNVDIFSKHSNLDASQGFEYASMCLDLKLSTPSCLNMSKI